MNNIAKLKKCNHVISKKEVKAGIDYDDIRKYHQDYLLYKALSANIIRLMGQVVKAVSNLSGRFYVSSIHTAKE